MRMLYGAARAGDATSGTTAAVEMLDEAGRAYPGLEAASVRVGRAVAAMRAEGGIAHRRLGEQADQFLAIDGIHSPTLGENRMRNMGDG